MNDIRDTKKPMEVEGISNSVSNPKIMRGMETYSMAGNQQTMAIATNCPGYVPIDNQFAINSSCGSAISCNACKNFQNNVCQVGLYDKVLASLDER